jgi:uncharacterized membrane protein YecN with MAPEG domain
VSLRSPGLRDWCWSRAHGHFAEYVPIITLMVAMPEMSGATPFRVHLLMTGLLLSRLMHLADPGRAGRRCRALLLRTLRGA